MRESKEYCGPGLPHPTNRPDYPTEVLDVTSPPSLDGITSEILDAMSERNHDIGYSDYEGDEYEDNYYCYDENGWYVELAYRLCGTWCIETGDYWTPPSTDLTDVWGEIVGLDVSYNDDDTGESYEFSEEELNDLRSRIYETIIDSISVL